MEFFVDDERAGDGVPLCELLDRFLIANFLPPFARLERAARGAAAELEAIPGITAAEARGGGQPKREPARGGSGGVGHAHAQSECAQWRVAARRGSGLSNAAALGRREFGRDTSTSVSKPAALSRQRGRPKGLVGRSLSVRRHSAAKEAMGL